MCHNDGKSAQTDKCVKSRIMTKVIDYVLSIDKFDQQCVFLKVYYNHCVLNITQMLLVLTNH